MVASSGDGLSLLWIVILVLLILWALGLISGGFGLGGFINILLVIALILLILWLLRII
ncbi:MAG: lmo0937 family membrane protein [Bacteroidetes bacterium]|nr:lmo0937 family membrane protein [Bacteroidota bacterium]